MPYFERLPYADMIARIAGSPSPGDGTQPAVKLPVVASPLMEQAAAILKEESAGLPSFSSSSSANRLRLPFLATASGAQPGFPSLTGSSTDVAKDVLLLDAPPPVRAGQTATIVLSMVNDSATSLSFSVMTTHLISRSGARIAANNIDISPEEAVLAPSQAVDVQVVVNVPAIIMPGEYAGLLQVYGQQTTRAVMVINVTNSAGD
jgi:hypothetical protein